MNFTGNIIFLLLLTVSVSAFTVTQTSYSYRTSTTAVRAETESRRAFMSTALGIAGFSFAASRAFADKFEDFSTPSEEPKDEVRPGTRLRKSPFIDSFADVLQLFICNDAATGGR